MCLLPLVTAQEGHIALHVTYNIFYRASAFPFQVGLGIWGGWRDGGWSGGWRDVVYSTRQAVTKIKMTSDIALLQTISYPNTQADFVRPQYNVQAKAEIDTIHICGKAGIRQVQQAPGRTMRDG